MASRVLWVSFGGTQYGKPLCGPGFLPTQGRISISLDCWRDCPGLQTCLPPSAVVQLLSCVWFSATLWTAAGLASLSFIVSLSLLKLMSTELTMTSNHLIPWCPLLLLPLIFFSIRVFSSESALHIRWPKYWSFSFSISLSNEYSGLISFRMDWFDLLAVQGTLKSLLQHHNSSPWVPYKYFMATTILWH